MIGATAAADRQLQTEEQGADERDRGDELEEAAPRVRAVCDRGGIERVAPAEEIRELQRDEDREERGDQDDA